MLMLQLQIFDKFNKHCKYLLQDLFKNHDIQYIHATMGICYQKINTTWNAWYIPHANKFSVGWNQLYVLSKHTISVGVSENVRVHKKDGYCTICLCTYIIIFSKLSICRIKVIPQRCFFPFNLLNQQFHPGKVTVRKVSNFSLQIYFQVQFFFYHRIQAMQNIR